MATSKKSGSKSGAKSGAKSSKKGGAKGAAKASVRQVTSRDAKRIGQTVNIEQLGRSVGEAVNRALATQNDELWRGRIICGIRYDLKSKTFQPIVIAE